MLKAVAVHHWDTVNPPQSQFENSFRATFPLRSQIYEIQNNSGNQCGISGACFDRIRIQLLKTLKSGSETNFFRKKNFLNRFK